MKRQILCFAMIAGLAACGGETAEEPAAPASEAAEEAEPMANAGAAPATGEGAAPAGAAASTPGEPPFAAKAGDRLKVAKQADCFETGAGADASPWTMFPGVTVEYRGAQDGKAKVVGASGKECLIAWDAVSPA